ncbi:hypothetical protein JKY79_03275 [Candidatus Babeliales bacterium]|nr:hypothetical protein [Candidatus Babeliales bacterium]
MIKNRTKPLILVIFDGFGISDKKAGNAIFKAKMPTSELLMKNIPGYNCRRQKNLSVCCQVSQETLR